MTFQTNPSLQAHAVVEAPNDLSTPLGRYGIRMVFARDEEIYAQEEDADLLYQVVSGTIRTTRFTSDGRRQIGDFYYPGDVFGIERAGIHRFSAEALTDCVVMVAKRTALELAAGRDFVEKFLAAATRDELNRAQDHLLLLGRKTACEKVATFLLDLSDRTGQPAELSMGRQDMADYLNLTIETVSRMVSHLQASGVVHFNTCRQFVVKNRAALERLAG
ncbi:MAG TPA: helix-turn-helix domain-containing protein [Caulobacteraceae bacterium]|nr:helix-turn-helix domain-containing protein [Caulobacteraceae bacterium]